MNATSLSCTILTENCNFDGFGVLKRHDSSSVLEYFKDMENLED